MLIFLIIMTSYLSLQIIQLTKTMFFGFPIDPIVLVEQLKVINKLRITQSLKKGNLVAKNSFKNKELVFLKVS